MKPDTIYYFERIPELKSRYRQIRHKGKSISEFPSVYKNGKYKGEGYIVFRKTSNYYNQKSLQFSHALELARSRIVTELYFLPEFPQQAYGAYKNYGLLIKFSKDFDKLVIWFFKDKQEAAPVLFQKLIAGEIPEVTKTETVKVKYKTVSSDL